MLYKILTIYFWAISLVSVLVCIYDKQAARKNRSRIPEKTLFLLAGLGGSVAMYITMRQIRHKTLHKRFIIGIPAIIILQIALLGSIVYLTR